MTFEGGGGPVFVGTDENSDTVLLVEGAQGPVTIDGLGVAGGSTLGSGGGMRAVDAEIVLRGSVFRGNQASVNGGGGAVFGNSASLDMDGCGCVLCRAGSRGGGFYVDAEPVRVESSEFLRNAADDGGGMWGNAGSASPRLVGG